MISIDRRHGGPHWTPLTRSRPSVWPASSSAACAAPGAVSTPSAAATTAQAAPSSTAAGGTASAASASASAAAAGPDCGTDPVTLNAYFETGFDLPFKLSDEFTKQYPNVTWDISRTSSRT